MNVRKDILNHLDITWAGFKNWMSAQVKDAAVVGLLWLIGLLIIGIPLAPLWAILGALFQFIPILGTILALVGPAFSAMFVEGWMPLVYVLILYALIVLADGFILQPMFMKRNARVPVWASILVPIVLGTIFNVWGILLAPPILAIIYSHRTGKTQHDSDESYQMNFSFKQEREEK